MASATTPSRRRTVNYPWVVFMAAVTLVLGWAANAAVALVTDWSGSLGWLAVPVVTVFVTLTSSVTTAHVESYQPAARPSTQPIGSRGPPHPPARRIPFPIAALLVAVVIGVMGVGLTFGVRFAVGWLTGDERGVERLVEPASHSEQGLSLTVEGIEQTRHFTRVTAVATNGVGNPMRLRLFGNAVLQAHSGATVQADSFRSDWVEELPPGATQRGVIVFNGHLPDEAKFARLSFLEVWEMGFEGPLSITVPEMRLRPPNETS